MKPTDGLHVNVIFENMSIPIDRCISDAPLNIHVLATFIFKSIIETCYLQFIWSQYCAFYIKMIHVDRIKLLNYYNNIILKTVFYNTKKMDYLHYLQVKGTYPKLKLICIYSTFLESL